MSDGKKWERSSGGSPQDARVQLIYWLGSIIGRYWAVAHMLVSAYWSPMCAHIKTVFKPENSAWISDLKWRNCVVEASYLLTNK